MIMSEIDFIELATFCVNRYRDSLTGPRVRYMDTLFVAIVEGNRVLCSKTPHILRDAGECILIHQRSEKAVTNWYSWYKVEYIDGEGCVFDGNLGEKFSLYIVSINSFSNQRMQLSYDNRVIYSCRRPWEDHMAKVWQLYSRVRGIESANEIKLIADLFKKDEKILELEKEIEDFRFSNRLLEQEREQYRDLLDEIRQIVGK